VITVAGFSFRYSSTTDGGHIEVMSSTTMQVMAYGVKREYNADLPGSTIQRNFRMDETYTSTWAPVLTLWDGSSFTHRVTLSTYETNDFEISRLSFGAGVTPVTIRVHATIDGYGNLVLRAEAF
jgi:hypothetical protein